LLTWNTNLFYAHLVQGIAQFAIPFVSDKAKAFIIPVTSLFCNWDAGYPSQTLESQHSMTLLRYTALFSLLSAYGHYTVLKNWDTYISDLKLGRNRYRW